MANIIYYKVLDGETSTYQRHEWSLPANGKLGAWMPAITGPLVECRNGYHLCHGAAQVIHWLGPEIYGAEVRGDILSCDTKIVVREVRLVSKVETWNECTARLFAADCAEHVLHLYESQHPGDDRPRKAIAAARAFAKGGFADATAAAAAAADAADAAAADAAWSAAWSAESAAWSAAARSAAARSAAAAWSAAANAAERAWQAQRLREYLTGERQ